MKTVSEDESERGRPPKRAQHFFPHSLCALRSGFTCRVPSCRTCWTEAAASTALAASTCRVPSCAAVPDCCNICCASATRQTISRLASSSSSDSDCCSINAAVCFSRNATHQARRLFSDFVSAKPVKIRGLPLVPGHRTTVVRVCHASQLCAARSSVRGTGHPGLPRAPLHPSIPRREAQSTGTTANARDAPSQTLQIGRAAPARPSARRARVLARDV